jgi:two-component system, NtrC family, nitrogen regulation response regulator NtrX
MRERRHVLVVDDDGGVREVIVEMLRDAGHRASTAEGGAAMRAILGRDDSVALVILDSELHGEQGQALAFHAKNLGLPVVMISGSATAMEFARAHRFQLLQKPFGYDDLLGAIDKAMASGEFGQRGV